jgi:hypothetical protein
MGAGRVSQALCQALCQASWYGVRKAKASKPSGIMVCHTFRSLFDVLVGYAMRGDEQIAHDDEQMAKLPRGDPWTQRF